jgi:starch phosphorylase
MASSRTFCDGRRDLERAVAILAERLPEPLLPLARLAYNYRWSWLHDGAAVFRHLDHHLWRRTGRNPRLLLESVAPARLREVAADAVYLARLERLAAALDADLQRPPAACGIAPDRPVAYFCSEFGVHSSLPLYGGGLGVLAGDLLKAASDLAIPMVGVGLLYREGYFHQRLDAEGWQHEYWTNTQFEQLPLVLVSDERDQPLGVELEMRGRTVRAQIWRVDLGRVPLYLLDTDRRDNHPIDRWITARLYIGDRHTRLAQYGVLGVGGVRALRAMGIDAGLVHLNEGHAALAGVERIGALLAQHVPLYDALARVREETVVTTHTPIAAGNEWYRVEEVEPVLGRLPDQVGVPRKLFYGLGRFAPDDEGEPVSITPLALRTSRAANGVSMRHGRVAREMWQRLWPEKPVEQVPIGHVTNGVHTTTWMSRSMQDLLDRHLPAGWREHVSSQAVCDAVAAIPAAELWAVRCQLRSALVERARELSVGWRLSRGETPEYVEAASRIFDPDVLTLGFARRVVNYKRLYLMVRHLDRGLRLLRDDVRPIQVVIAGKAHPQDAEAKQTLQTLMRARGAPEVPGRIIFFEDYDLNLAPLIMAGVDLWVNTPRPPLEACGTSGMKVVLNGGLNLSVLDGWWEEAYDGETGWGIHSSPEGGEGAQDDRDGIALFNLLEHEVIPLFYERNAEGIPERWLARVRASMRRLIPRFSAERMVRDYVERYYVPAAAAAAAPRAPRRRARGAAPDAGSPAGDDPPEGG